jgi:hypothetical protein
VITRTDRGRPLPPVSHAGGVLAAKWPQIALSTIDLPGGWYDVADVFLACLTGQCGEENFGGAGVLELGHKDERLIVRLDGVGLRERGAAAFATAVSARIDQAAGAAKTYLP